MRSFLVRRRTKGYRWFCRGVCIRPRRYADEYGQCSNRRKLVDVRRRHDGLTIHLWQSIFFTGCHCDWETGLYHCRARMYNPGLKRFIQVDSRARFGKSNEMFLEEVFIAE
ncbi:MAG: hypothetical protein JW828_14295 [Sedimentisphaerales bacterium]|nr:hypothetical protein [Sedimentisphaerales bacterium]